MSGIMNMLVAAKTTVAAAVDEFFNRVTLLLNTGSTNGAQNNTFLDSSTNNFTVTRNGNATQGTFTPFSQTGWSNFLDGTDDYFTVPYNIAFAPASSDFTVEAWVYFASAPGATSAAIVGNLNQSTGNGDWSLFYRGGSTRFEFACSSSGLVAGLQRSYYSITPVAGTWYHIVGVKSGSTLSCYVNGTKGTDATLATVNNGSLTTYIGIGSDLTADVFGYISNLRIVKGTAVYSGSSFSVPTTPLTAITNTSFLSCQSNRFIDNSSNAFTITSAGTPSVQAFSPFAPTIAYDTTTVGGSGYFDGTGDYLTSTITAISNTTMTMECLVYNTALDNTNGNHFITVNNVGNTNYAIIHDGNGKARFFSRNNSGVVIFDISSATGVLKLNQWQHIVGVRTSNNASLFVEGNRVATTASPTTSTTDGTSLYISSNAGTGRMITGYVSSARIVSGTAVYDPTLTTCTIPTAPLTAIPNTKFLCNFTNAGITDATGKNVLETVGNAQISTTQSKFGGASIAFDGTGDWLLIPHTVDQMLGTGAFTIEMWVYRNSSGTYGLVGKGTGTTGWLVSLNSSNQVVFTYGSSTITSTGTISATTWTYIAVVREGTGTNQTKIYISGSNDGTGTVSTDFNQTNAMYVGADRTGGSAFNGYIDDLRITKGYARTIATPSSAFALQ